MSQQKTSRIPEFYKKTLEERLNIVAEYAGLTQEEVALLKNFGNLDPKIADSMIENVIGAMSYPFAVAVNFLINGKDYLVPMVIEEASVVAAASNAARVMRRDGGIKSIATQPVMIGQIQVLGVKDPWHKRMIILEHKDEIIQKANEVDPVLVKFGGGAKDVEARVVEGPRGPMIIVHLLVDVRDAMGANAVNTMAEKVAPMIERLTGGRVLLRIISNLADRRLVRSWVKVYKEDIGGEEVVDAIVDAWAFAAADPYRAATHNKGIMNGVIAVALATAQDHRAIEAGAHAYAARTGRYVPLSTWEKDQDGNLVGTLEMPMAVGIIGGATKVHPIAKVALKILGVKTATELAEVMGAVGLAQNFAALRALATEGIQKGHMRLHARNLAIMAGATGDLIDKVVEIMVSENKISFAYAQELVNKLSKEGKA
ncbi:3-hydroxy-3-methylglutaryl-CoA reductase [Thermofilum adornatum]|jgi:hydroxymethylglutaryl-CoA reductase|uniref:3-hydroxy-3-methylglutaryl coenzyme A reductase n=2 Tax=Thermofilum adornatum TaxID=1365176 RepID=S5ZWM9_9CREN|nr:3-hydroxy-3-methylglutaryl-CoA reductase [Thermofilum adornatum]AJB41376.1 Hydroxymethylglutaryl-CoA reductase [Thermofilum adornatum 1505]